MLELTPEIDIVVRLLVTAVFAGIVGYERERAGRDAGLRTHVLVGVGSCLMMQTGLYMADLYRGLAIDPTRIAAQVVSGVGFLGAGTIFRTRASVRGLTTAASLWAVTGIGLAIGCGFYLGGLTATGVTLLSLLGLKRVERGMRRDTYRALRIELENVDFELEVIREALATVDVDIRDFRIKRTGACTLVELDLKMFSDQDQAAVVQQVQRLAGVQRVSWV